MKRGLGRLPVLAAGLLLAALAPAADAAPREAKPRALERSPRRPSRRWPVPARCARAAAWSRGGAEPPALAELSARYEALDPAERREADRLLARPTDGATDPQGDGYTVPEHAPFCTANFCLHWVTSPQTRPTSRTPTAMTSRTTSRRWPRSSSSRARARTSTWLAAAGVRRCQGGRRPARRLPHRARRHQRARLRRDRRGPARSAREVRVHGDGPGAGARHAAGHRRARVQPRAAVRLRRRARTRGCSRRRRSGWRTASSMRSTTTSASSRPGRRSTRSRSRAPSRTSTTAPRCGTCGSTRSTVPC